MPRASAPTISAASAKAAAHPASASLFELEPPVLSVKDSIELMNVALESFAVTIRGEITQLSNRGHVYFTLSDSDPKQKAVLSCALWKFRVERLPFRLEEGLEVQVTGKPNIYAPSGRLTFVVEHISPVGEGALKKAFEALKQQLQQEGLFATEHKQPIPQYPQTIAVITSSQGDAIKDFRTHLGSFGYRILLTDVRVEGINAINSIVAAIEHCNAYPAGAELIVVTRGGGSLESLQAFNSEAVARAIFASKLPVVSAVGHENDVTIADLVADVRASTPTDAGKLLSQHWRAASQTVAESARLLQREFIRRHREQEQQLVLQRNRLLGQWQHQLASKRGQLSAVRQSLLHASQRQQHRFSQQKNRFHQALERYWLRCQKEQLLLTQMAPPWLRALQTKHRRHRIWLSELAPTWQHHCSRQHTQQHKQLSQYEQLLRLADPDLLLKKGYALVYTASGEMLSRPEQLTTETLLRTQLSWGTIASRVTSWTTSTSKKPPQKGTL